ncbi:MAG: Holliday junction branch migration protein RuvA [Pseudomonadota bacterium]
MIGKIAGRIEYRAEDHVLIDVRGVGYLVFCSDRTLAALPSAGEAVALYTDLLVREDNLQLFGFMSLVEKEWHRLLTSVQGIGAKASMAILGALGSDAVGRAIALGDWHAVATAKGVGPKTAQRVVNELKDKAPKVMALGAQSPDAEVLDDGEPRAGPQPKLVQSADAGAEAAALSALQNLGYGPGEAAEAVASVAADGATGEAEMIRAALKHLAPKG